METEFEVFIYDVFEANLVKTDEERKAFLLRRIKKYLEKHPAIKTEYDRTYQEIV